MKIIKDMAMLALIGGTAAGIVLAFFFSFLQ